MRKGEEKAEDPGEKSVLRWKEWNEIKRRKVRVEVEVRKEEQRGREKKR